MNHHTPKRHGARLGRGKHQVVPDLGPYESSGHHPLGGGIRGCRGKGLAFVFARRGGPAPHRRGDARALCRRADCSGGP